MMSRSDEFNECPCTGKTLAKLIQPAVLVVLAEKTLHGYVIVQRLGEMAMFRGQCPDAAGVYRVLRSMEERGLLTASWDTGKAGPAKRHFTLTKRGRACIRRWRQTLEEYAESVDDLLKMLRGLCGSRRTKSRRRLEQGTRR